MKLRTGVCLAALLACIPAAYGQPAPDKQTGRWAQDYTGRQADPSVRFGTLPNGLRYAIVHNTTPSDGVAMRMRIGSGSIVERDEEQGLAHFLEHMAFRGSAHVPDGEVVHMLERQGLRFGPDTNAFTAHDETVYMFTFPRADASALDTGLTLFREIGERLKLDPAAIDAERGVVLSEERLRDVPPYEATKADLGNALAGTRAVSRWPIGHVETIKAATADRIGRYYRANYRPDNATIVIVGNIDVAAMESAIKARFSDWKPAAAPDRVDVGAPVPVQAATEYVAPGVQDQLTLAWVKPVDRRAETEAFDREQLLQLIGLTALNDRLADRAALPGSPFVGANAGAAPSLIGSAALTRIGISAAPAKWPPALAAVIEEQRQLIQNGIRPAELARAVAVLRTELQTLVAQSTTRTSASIADQIVGASNDDQLYTSPAQDLALAEPILASVTPAMATEALKAAFSGHGPVLFRSAQAGPATSVALQQALAGDYTQPLAARTAETNVVWPYTGFGAPSRVVSQSDDKELGATIVGFADGTRLIVKPTSFEKGKVEVAVGFGHGRETIDAGLVHALWAMPLFTVGGTGRLSAGDIQKWAQSHGKVISAQLTARVPGFYLTGTTTPADLASEMQLLAAYARDPGFRPELGEKLAAIGPTYSGQLEANAGAVFGREAQVLMAGGAARYAAVPAAADIAATVPADLPAALRPALAGAADVTIVGDVTVAAAIAVTQASFAAGAPSPRQPAPPVSVTIADGRAEAYTVTHGGRADQAYFGEYWRLPDYFANPALSYAGDVAAAVLQTRLIDIVREKLGITYSPRTEAIASLELAGQGYFDAVIETPQANFAAFRTILDQQVQALAGAPVSADELARAKQPLIEGRTKDFETNTYWLGSLPDVLRDPRAKAPVLDQVTGVRAVTAADVQQLFARYIAGKVPTTVVAKAR